ncbi:MAG: BamA/TamA family outer membrane protein [Candidatus Neomarinimicrobiota bacterium]
MRGLKHQGYWWCLIIAGCLWTVSLAAEKPLVTSISFVGNDRTQEYILRRELCHPLSVPLDSTLMNQDRDRLDNLHLFSMVRWFAYPQPDSTVEVKFFLVETWRYLPGLAPVYDEKTGWSLSGLLLVNNFRGRNQSLQFSGIVGGLSSFGLSFYDPWIAGDRISLELQYQNQHYSHFFLPFNERRTGATLTIGKKINNQHKLRGGLELRHQVFTKTSYSKKFDYLVPSATYYNDTRNIYSDPFRGHLLQSTLAVGAASDGTGNNYLNLYNSCSVFRKLAGTEHRLVLAANLRGDLRFGYRHDLLVQYLGGAFTVRGWVPPDRRIYADPAREFRFGHQLLIAALELRQTLIPKFVTELQNEAGLITVIFFDAGLISPDIAGLVRQQPLFGTGIGLRIPFPLVGQMRLDYGWGYHAGKPAGPRLHLAFGHSF